MDFGIGRRNAGTDGIVYFQKFSRKQETGEQFIVVESDKVWIPDDDGNRDGGGNRRAGSVDLESGDSPLSDFLGNVKLVH